MSHVHHKTYADYLVCSNTYGDELINGTLHVREPPAPSPSHQWIAGELYHQVATALVHKNCRVCIAPFDVRLPKADELDEQIDTVVQPDVFIVCDPRKFDARGMRGAPDWVAEVLSPSTARRDQVLKLAVYERARVPELWLVDPIRRSVALYHLEAGRYGPPKIVELKGQLQLTAVAGVTIDWDQVVARIS
jgi:Uma2 family endonuclease